jgi:hypothetical protein
MHHLITDGLPTSQLVEVSRTLFDVGWLLRRAAFDFEDRDFEDGNPSLILRHT